MRLALSQTVLGAMPGVNVHALFVRAIDMAALRRFRVEPPQLECDAGPVQRTCRAARRSAKKSRTGQTQPAAPAGLDLYQAAALFGLTPFAMRGSSTARDSLILKMAGEDDTDGPLWDFPAGARAGELRWEAITHREVTAMSWGGDTGEAELGAHCHLALVGERLGGEDASAAAALDFLRIALAPHCRSIERCVLDAGHPVRVFAD
ncbi:hypothetical protein [Paludibacterium paludis]|uniref:Uncharacterized protein n=1 Tax=Paludibacterium paludis TaxID=1225769 RepID=A0A918NZQ4_9NEIS|nr:hypothetical protein [Paludibacterium paludis]GGY07678.1 hypothetical protein GCM10011289_07700 [Paludibacterium paludis]